MVKNFIINSIAINLTFIVMMVSGCSLKKSFHFDPKQINSISNNLHNWQLKGKISWYYKPTNYSAICYMDWRINQQKSIVTFRSLMNIKHITIENNCNKFKIIDSSDNITTIKQNLENIIKVGTLNLGDLNYWLLGAPNINKSYNLINNGFTQDNWIINYDSYKLYQGLYFPTIINISNVKANIIIKVFISSLEQQNP